VLGGLLGLAGAGVHALAPWGAGATAIVVVALCAVAVVLDLGAFGLRVPTIRRQVNEDMLHEYREWAYGLSFGFQLGLGVITIVTSTTVYVTFALAFLTASWPAGLLVGGVFGLARALPMLLVSRVDDPIQLRRLFRRIEGWAPLAQRGALGLLVIAGSAAAVSIWSSSALG
jgi:sulfite exporter TauE/SafE